MWEHYGVFCVGMYVQSWCTQKKPSFLSRCGWMPWRTLVYSFVCVWFKQCFVYMINYVEDFQEVLCLFLYPGAFFANASFFFSAEKCLFREGSFSVFLMARKKKKSSWHSQVPMVNWCVYKLCEVLSFICCKKYIFCSFKKNTVLFTEGYFLVFLN